MQINARGYRQIQTDTDTQTHHQQGHADHKPSWRISCILSALGEFSLLVLNCRTTICFSNHEQEIAELFTRKETRTSEDI